MEKVYSNVDVLYEIFQYLNLEEHLKLTRVCKRFRIVVVDFIWKNKYKNLEVCKTSQHFGMLLTNNTSAESFSMENQNEIGFESVKEDKTVLNKKDIETFLQLIVNNIKVLVLYSPNMYFKFTHDENEVRSSSPLIFNPTEFGVPFDSRHRFINLTTIVFQHVILTEKDLKFLNNNCNKLEKLSFENCFNNNEKTLVVGDDIKISTIQNMTSLKCFEIVVFDAVDKDLSYDMNKILKTINIKQLILRIRNFALIDEDEYDVSIRALRTLTYACEDLTIGYFRSQRIFRKFNNTILYNFKNLKKLSLESWSLISVNEEFFKKLSKTCTQLEYLKLQYFEINGFAAIASLSNMVLESCTGLIWRDIKTMLSDMKLNKFSIFDTEYIGMFEYFNVAPTLNTLVAINCQRNHLKQLFEMNNGLNLRNLTTLIWQDNFAQIPIYVSTSCLQLKTLVTEPSTLLINSLYSLNCLEKLTLRVNRKIKFSRILIILKHPCLQHFALTKLKGPDGYDECNDYLIDYDIRDQELMEFEDKKISLTFINISLNNYFKIIPDFWFNLLRNNLKLKIMIRYNRFVHHDHTFLKYIINQRNFPKRLKFIKICGYKIGNKENFYIP